MRGLAELPPILWNLNVAPFLHPLEQEFAGSCAPVLRSLLPHRMQRACMEASRAAAAIGSIPLLAWTLAVRPRDSAQEGWIATAAKHGHVHILEWYWQRARWSIEMVHSACFAAAETAELRVLDWLSHATRACPCVCAVADRTRHPQLMEWLRRNRCVCQRAFAYCARHVELLYLQEQGVAVPERAERCRWCDWGST